MKILFRSAGGGANKSRTLGGAVDTTLGTAFGEGPITTKNAAAPQTPSLKRGFLRFRAIPFCKCGPAPKLAR